MKRAIDGLLGPIAIAVLVVLLSACGGGDRVPEDECARHGATVPCREQALAKREAPDKGRRRNY